MDDNLVQTIIVALIAAAPGFFLAVWAWVKAHAAATEATWDDEAVALVEKIAQGVISSKKV